MQGIPLFITIAYYSLSCLFGLYLIFAFFDMILLVYVTFRWRDEGRAKQSCPGIEMTEEGQQVNGDAPTEAGEPTEEDLLAKLEEANR